MAPDSPTHFSPLCLIAVLVVEFSHLVITTLG